MTLIVEDGSCVPGAESYVAVNDCQTYATNRALAFDTTSLPAAEAALRRATAYVDTKYRLRFPGYRTLRRAQPLEWPRAEAFYYQPDTATRTPFFIDPRAFYPYDLIPMNAIPIEITKAVCEGAIRELAEPGVLRPDLERGGGLYSVKAGSVNVTYGGSATPNTAFQAIEAALSPLLPKQSGYTARASR